MVEIEQLRADIERLIRLQGEVNAITDAYYKPGVFKRDRWFVIEDLLVKLACLERGESLNMLPCE